MPPESSVDFEAILRVLDAHGVKYIVVGGVSALLHGAQVATFDLDVVHLRSHESQERLLTAREEVSTASA